MKIQADLILKELYIGVCTPFGQFICCVLTNEVCLTTGVPGRRVLPGVSSAAVPNTEPHAVQRSHVTSRLQPTPVILIRQSCRGVGGGRIGSVSIRPKLETLP